MYQLGCFLLKKAVLTICGNGVNHFTIMTILVLHCDCILTVLSNIKYETEELDKHCVAVDLQ